MLLIQTLSTKQIRFDEFPPQRASDAENIFMSWRHHECLKNDSLRVRWLGWNEIRLEYEPVDWIGRHVICVTAVYRDR